MYQKTPVRKRKMRFRKLSEESGFTLANVLTTLSLIAITSGIVVSNIKSLENPLVDATYQVTRFMRLTRSRAISQTAAIKIQPSTSSEILAYKSDSCSGTMTLVNDLSLTLPNGSSLGSTSWSACFTQRGLSDTNLTFQIQNQKGRTKTIELALGGGIQVQ